MAIFNSEVTNSTASSIFTAITNSAATTVYFCNKTPNSCTVNVFVVANTFAANGINIIYSNLTIAGYDTYIMESERLLFSANDFLAANASAGSSVVSTISYTEI